MCSPSFCISLLELNSLGLCGLSESFSAFHSVLSVLSLSLARSLADSPCLASVDLCAQVNHEDKMISYSHPGLTAEDGSSSVAGNDSELDA